MKLQRVAFIVLTVLSVGVLQAAPPQSAAPAYHAGAGQPAVVVPSDYVIGTEDVLGVVFWKDKDLSVDVVVRPDGKITLPLGKEITAAGLTPDQFRDAVVEEAKVFVENPAVNIVIKQINSRKVFITGQVEKPGGYPLMGQMTVMQLIATAGGLKEFAKAKEIVVMRGSAAFGFNYDDIRKGRRIDQNIALRPGDTVVIP